MEAKRAVDAGYWHMYRFNPSLLDDGKNPFILDSKEPQWDKFQDFLMGEVRYTTLLKEFPDTAKELFKIAEEDAKWRYKTYTKLSQSAI
jgi:pyruvate-ferredoxin/flavodoxin oxidoreductase